MQVSHSKEILSTLNKEQRQAVTTTAGPLLVLAGAGTGKTKTITHRAAHLVSQKIPASQILAVAFTKKAALEMKERTTSLLGQTAEKMTICTFHSLGFRIIREQHENLSYGEDVSVISEQKRLKIIESIIDHTELHLRAKDKKSGLQLAAVFSRMKNAGFLLEHITGKESASTQLLLKMFESYEETLRQRNQVDFDDLIKLPYRLLSNDVTLRNRYQQRYQHLMIDEYQDTNRVQYKLIRCLVGAKNNLGVFGDDDQAIYAFRGADVTRIRRFKEDYSSATVIRLETNYRSYQPIVTLANQVINLAPDRIRKRLFSHRGAGKPVTLSIVKNDQKELEVITKQIKKLVAQQRAAKDIACLFRTRKHARQLRQRLKSVGLPVGKNGISLLTLHESKGLQFPVVFLPGLEDDVLPSWHAGRAGREAIEEERRLFYVGITRAEDELYISSASERNHWPRQRSRFLTSVAPFVAFASDGRYELAK